MSQSVRSVAAFLLLLVGVQLWLVIGKGQYASCPHFTIVLALFVLASLPPVYRRCSAALDRIRHPSNASRIKISCAIFFFATLFLIWTGFYQHRELFPKMHDESMHLLQMRLLSTGRLWIASHPLADSFEASHILVKPVYASIYFPGTSLVYLPAIWLHLPYWLLPSIVAGASVGLIYFIVADLLDGVGGALAALLLISLSMFRYLSMLVMSHSVMLLLGLLMIAAWLRWQKKPTAARAAVVGAIAGLAAITRPADALCYAMPVAIAMLISLRSIPLKRALTAIACAIAAAAPFLAMQLTLNVGVTGKLFETPYRLYCDWFTPDINLGFHAFDPSARPRTSLPQKLAYYREYTIPAVKAHQFDGVVSIWTRNRLPMLAYDALPSELLLILVPLSLLGFTRRRMVLLGALPLFILAYACFAYFFDHYVVPIAPTVIFAVVLGADSLVVSFPTCRAWLATLSTAMIAMLACYALPQFNRLVVDDPFQKPIMTFNHNLSAMVQKPAIVLFHYDVGHDNPHEEPVYNLDAVNPDDEQIIRAQDRSPEQNQKLFDYYAQRQPGRHVYWVDRGKILTDSSYRPRDLGLVKNLATHPATTSSAASPRSR